MNISNVEKLKFNIKDTDYVLDIGGGHVPFERANVIVDKFPEPEYDFSQRADCSIKIPEGAKFIKTDAAHMPFRDKEFDFVVCAETLNHVRDPIAVCREIIRVGKRGYIEVPSALQEIFVSHLEHLWVCLWDGVTLGFIKNDYPENTLSGPSKKAVNNHVQGEAYKLVTYKMVREAIYIEFIWEKSFKYELIQDDTKFDWDIWREKYQP